ncbi:MAG: SMP-30/gluconolactonase/LRE family protein, partial [Pseudomonadota bacterium]
AGWGDESCPAPDAEAFSPHGIDLVLCEDGATALLVVNHGGREAVEFFEVADSGDLAWRGCALPPEDPFINDVAARSDGGFYVTHMWNKTGSFEDTVAALNAGEPTGWVWAWTPAEGFNKLPNSDDLMPNGIAINADNTMLFVNVYMGNKAFSMNLADNSRVNELALQQPDNVSVDAEGNLWFASHRHDPIGQACTAVTAGPCLLPFQVLKADPATLEGEVVVDHDGPPAGYVTVALRVDDRLYLGTAHGDRVVSIDL